MNKSRILFDGIFFYLAMLIASSMLNSEAKQLATKRHFHWILNKEPTPPITSEDKESLTSGELINRPMSKKLFNVFKMETLSEIGDIADELTKSTTSAKLISKDCKKMEACKKHHKDICAQESNYGWVGRFVNICVMWKANCFRVGRWVIRDPEMCTSRHISAAVTESDIDEIISIQSNQHLMETDQQHLSRSNNEHTETSTRKPKIRYCAMMRACNQTQDAICASNDNHKTMEWFENICVMWKANCYKLGPWVLEDNEVCIKEDISDALTDGLIEHLFMTESYKRYMIQMHHKYN